MDSASSAEPPPLPPQHPTTHVLGTLVALLTLILPLGAIAYFSAAPPPPAGNVAPLSRTPNNP